MARVDRRRVTIGEDARRPDRPRAARARPSSRPTDRPLRIGSFSAASNVTGILSDTRAISVLLHRHGALSFWDFAAAAPVRRDRDGAAPAGAPDADARDYKDAIVLSPHKFIGGPGHAGRPRRPPRAVPQPRPDRARRRHGRLRQPARARLPRRPRASRGGRHAGDRRVDPGRPRVPAQGARSAVETIRAREEDFIDRAIAAWSGRARDRDPRQPGAAAAVDRVVHGPPRRPLPPPQLRRRRCSTTCSGSSRAAAARAPGRTAIACSGSTSRPRTRSSARSPAAARGSSPAGSG